MFYILKNIANFLSFCRFTLLSKLSCGSSTPKEKTLGEISPGSRANSCCIIIHWFLWKPSPPRAWVLREKNHSQKVARTRAKSFSCQYFLVHSSWHLQFWLKTFLSSLRINCCLYDHFQETANSLASQCRRSSETDLDKSPRKEKKYSRELSRGSRCRRVIMEKSLNNTCNM